SAAPAVAGAKPQQTITFDSPRSPAVYDTTFSVSASSPAGNATIAAGGVCTISGSTVTMTSGTGVCTLTASSAATAEYSAADNVVRTVDAAKATQTITPYVPNPGVYAQDYILTAGGSHGTGAVSFSTGGAACAVSGS